jgi:hypothetical protein
MTDDDVQLIAAAAATVVRVAGKPSDNLRWHGGRSTADSPSIVSSVGTTHTACAVDDVLELAGP